MAQRWFSAHGQQDEEVRVWVVSTRVTEVGQIFWADVRRADLGGMRMTVRRGGRWRELGGRMDERIRFLSYFDGVWKSAAAKYKARERVELTDGQIKELIERKEKEDAKLGLRRKRGEGKEDVVTKRQ